MNIDVQQIVMQLVAELNARSVTAQAQKEGVVMLYERLKQAATQQAPSDQPVGSPQTIEAEIVPAADSSGATGS